MTGREVVASGASAGRDRWTVRGQAVARSSRRAGRTGCGCGRHLSTLPPPPGSRAERVLSSRKRIAADHVEGIETDRHLRPSGDRLAPARPIGQRRELCGDERHVRCLVRLAEDAGVVPPPTAAGPADATRTPTVPPAGPAGPAPPTTQGCRPQVSRPLLSGSAAASTVSSSQLATATLAVAAATSLSACSGRPVPRHLATLSGDAGQAMGRCPGIREQQFTACSRVRAAAAALGRGPHRPFGRTGSWP